MKPNNNLSEEEKDNRKYGVAYFGKRPMPTFNNYWGIAAHNIFDNLTNTEICHEQLFFEDETNENIGFGWFGLFSEKSTEIDKYSMNYKLYDARLMHQAVENVDPVSYSLLGGRIGKIIDSIINIFGKDINDMIVGTGSKNNCQDWADNVRKEYKNLYKELPKEDRKQIKKELENYKKEYFNEK